MMVMTDDGGRNARYVRLTSKERQAKTFFLKRIIEKINRFCQIIVVTVVRCTTTNSKNEGPAVVVFSSRNSSRVRVCAVVAQSLCAHAADRSTTAKGFNGSLCCCWTVGTVRRVEKATSTINQRQDDYESDGSCSYLETNGSTADSGMDFTIHTKATTEYPKRKGRHNF